MEMTKYKLGDVCEIFGRIGFRGYTAQDLVESPKDGAITLSPTNIVNGELDFTNSTYLSWDKYEESPEIKINENDIVVVKTASVGKCALVRKLPHPTTLNPQFVVLKKIQADPVYLSYIIKGKCFQSSLKAITAGSVVPTLSQKHMADIEIYLPDLKNQKKIAAVLSALDDKIALNKKMNQKLEAMAKRLYDYWFVQYDFPDKNGHPYKTTGGPMTENPTLKREIPVGWEVKTIGDYLKIGNGRDHSKLADGLYPVYGSGGIMRYVAEYLHDGETVLFPRKGTLNNVMYRNEPLWTVDTMFYTSVLVPHSALFVFYSAKMFDFERLNTGTGVPSMTSDIIKKLPIISPDKHTLEQFDKTVAKLYNQIHHNEKEISRLTKLRDKLLPLLMNGQATVT